jgi:TRAP transporter TAXI family solute receptor
MKENSRKMFLFTAVLLVAMVFTVNMSLAADRPDNWPKTVAIASGTGTTYYAIAGGIGKMMENYLKVAGIPTKTSGGMETARLMAKGDLQMGFLTPDMAYEASMGVERFKKDGPAPIRVFLQDFPLHYNLIVLEGSGIESWNDIRGKTGYYRSRGSGLMEVLWDASLAVYGIKENEFKKILPFDRASEWIDGLKTGKVDFALDMGFHPSSRWTELASTHPMKIIGMDEAHLDMLKKKLPYVFSLEIPAGTYKTMPEPVTTPAVAIVVDVTAGMPDDFVYEVTKMIWTHFDEFKTYSPVCKFFNTKAVNRSNYIYHPGAIKYYKEIGVWTKALDDRQAKLLAEIEAKK